MENHNSNGDHIPVLFEGHGKDARYNGPLIVSPTISAAYGEGGGNIPLVLCAIPFDEPHTDSGKRGESQWRM